MRLSTRTRYGVRAMVELAMHDGKRPVDMGEISRNQGISKKYLHSLLVALKNGGLIQSVLGSGGGYLLSRKPGEINLFEIFTLLEGTTSLVECVSDAASCDRSEDCAAQKLWARLSGIIRSELEKTTLESLLPRGTDKAKKKS